MHSTGRLVLTVLSLSTLATLAGPLACSSSSDGAEASDEALSSGAPIVSGIGGRCLDDAGGGTANRNKIDIHACDGSVAQSWVSTGGTFVGPGGKCLGVKSGVQKSGTVVDLYQCNGSSGQQWTVSGSAIKSAGGLCLDVAGGANADGTQVQIYTCNGTAAQSWKVGRAGSGGAPSTCGKAPTPASGSPTIFTVPGLVAPGETALLFGSRVGTGATVSGARLADSAPGLPPGSAPCLPTGALALDVVQTSATAAKAVIPASFGAGMYAVVVSNGSGPGAPVLVNRPRIDWVHGGPGGSLVSGGTFEVYGRNLGAQPSAWLTSASGTITALTRTASAVGAAGASGNGGSSDGYVETFEVPTLGAGSYTLHAHNGHGGVYGFSDGFAVSVARAAAAWPTTVYKVAANTGNDDQALAKALASAAGGGIIELASGSYKLSHGVVIPEKVVLRSETGNRADVTITFDEPVSPFPYGFTGNADFTVESITVKSSTAARLFQCPNGPDFMRDPVGGGPQYQPDAPCENVKLHDVDFTLTTLRDRNGTGDPTYTDLAVINGTDCEISDSSLVNKGGGALSVSNALRFYLLRNTIFGGTTRVSPFASEPLSPSEGGVGGDSIFYYMRDSAIVGNIAGPGPGMGAGGTMGIEYDAHDLYIADNTFENNLTDYGEGFSFDAPYYPSFIGAPSSSGASTVTLPTVKNAAGNSVFQGPRDGKWAAATTASPTASNGITLVGESLVVVNGTGLGQYAAIVGNAATSAQGLTTVTLDRDFVVPLDGTSVVAITVMKSEVVFARNSFSNVGVGAQLYAGGYDFLIDGTKGEAVEGTYCEANDFMSERTSASDLQRRFSACFFNQFVHTAMTNKVDTDYPWWVHANDGLTRPYANGFVGVHFGVGRDPIPAQRGLGAVGNIFRDNQVQDFSYGLVYSGGGGPPPSPVPTLGEDNIIENDTTSSVPTGIVVQASYPGTLVRNSSCTSGCTTSVSDQSE